MEKENKELTVYDKNKIIEGVAILLKYYNISKTKKEVIKATHLLIDKVRYTDTNYVTLESDFIEEILFIKNEDDTKYINTDIFHFLVSLGADLKDVCFDNVHISGYHFNAFKNMEINIQAIPNSDISNTSLKGVKVNGTLDGANIKGTNFTGYIGDLVLNPQLIQNKNLDFTSLNGITVNGSFDGVYVSSMRTEGFKGEIIINPQKVAEKRLWCIDLNGVRLVGEYDEKTGTYNDPCFDGCSLHETSFKGCIGNVVIPLDKIYRSAALCNFTGVKLTGKIQDDEDITLLYSYYEDENGKKVYLIDDKDNSEEKDIDEKSVKINTHRTKTRKPTFINRIFGTPKK